MRYIAIMLRRRVGPIDWTLPRLAGLVVLCGVLLWTWRTNSRVAAFYCSDEILVGSRSCPGVDEYVGWHTAISILSLLVIPFILS
jgi:hypothetical protein